MSFLPYDLGVIRKMPLLSMTYEREAWAGAVAHSRDAHLRRKERAEDGAPGLVSTPNFIATSFV